MPNLLSPGVAIQEINTLTNVQQSASTVGGFAGFFRWGPVNQRILMSSESGAGTGALVNTFQPPNSNNAVFY